MSCRATKGLDCVFPIWFTQCGRVWFTFAMSMPCPCRAVPCRAVPCRATKGLDCVFPIWFTQWGRVCSHLPCHVQVVPCRATKDLKCVFPIWFTQCGRVWFIFAKPCPCRAHAVLRPRLAESDFSRSPHSTACAQRAMCELAFTIHGRSQSPADPDTNSNRHVEPLTVPNFTSRKLTCWSLVLIQSATSTELQRLSSKATSMEPVMCSIRGYFSLK